MSQFDIVHICPFCKKTSTNGNDFEKIYYREDPIMIDGFRYCSSKCRAAMNDDYEDARYQLKRSGIRSEHFRSDRGNP